MSAQSVPVLDTTPKEELTFSVQDQLLALHLQQVVLQRARTLLCQKNRLLRQHFKLVARPLVVLEQVEALLLAVQLEKETRLPYLSVCCDSHCNRTSR